MKYIAVITGASSGIGREFAYAIDQSISSIDEIWLIARRLDRLEAGCRACWMRVRKFVRGRRNVSKLYDGSGRGSRLATQ